MTKGGLGAAAPLVGPAPQAPLDVPAGAGPAVASTRDSASGGSGSQGGRAIASGVVPAAAVSTARPWLAARPTGNGSIVTATLPSPWVGGHISESSVWAYLPPGYAGGAARYPFVYAVPWDFAHWQLGIHITSMLDQEITSGVIPPVIVVFVDLSGGVFPVSECADSYTGVERADTYVSRTVVAWADRMLRTIGDPRARTIMGFSQGGFCAANLLMRHPDVFGNAVVFSGYFVAGLYSGDTVNAWRPFGQVPSVLAANSPIDVAPTLPATVRHRLFVVLSAQPTEQLYGPQAMAFTRVLERGGFNVDLLWTPLGHAWAAVRAEMPAALEALGGRMVADGVLM
jgi:enterochelin esterase-like enzyme